MSFDVTYAFASGHGLVTYPETGVAAPTITGTPAVQDATSFTITGSNFSSSGNRVFVGNTEVSVLTESTTQITTVATEFVFESMVNTVGVSVINASGVESNLVSVTIAPAAGQKVALIDQNFLGDASTRLEGFPDLALNNEIILANPTGTNVTIADVHVAGNGTIDVTSDSDGDPNVASVQYKIYDGNRRSPSWGTVTFAGPAVSQTTVPNVAGMTQAAAESAALAASMIARVQGTGVYSSTVAIDRVAIQFPAATTSVNVGTILEIQLSLGIAPILAPDLSGMTPVAAAAACSALSLSLGQTRRYIDGSNTGLVVNQSITSATPVAAGTTIDIAISSNLAPSVVGMAVSEAFSTLIAANLTPDSIVPTEYHDTALLDVVVRQSPPADTAVSPLDVVRVTASLGPFPYGAAHTRAIRVMNT
jgi:beta-lactam-binding protein with PASTA domain